MSFTDSSAPTPRVRFASKDTFPRHTYHFATEVAVTGDSSQTPDAAIDRAMLLYIAQNLPRASVGEAIESLASLSGLDLGFEEFAVERPRSKSITKACRSTGFAPRKLTVFEDEE